MVALELEVLAKKMDRFGWERDRGSAAHDRIITDWMDALQDYPLDEVRAACREAVMANPGKIPNEGHIVAKIREGRAAFLHVNPPRPAPEQKRERIKGEVSNAICQEFGYGFKRFGGEP